MMINPESLLKSHIALRTHDIEEFHAYIAGMVGSHTRYVVDPGPVTIELRHASLGRINVGLHFSDASSTVEREPRSSDDFLIQFPLSGSIDLEIDGRVFAIEPGAGAVISPDQGVRRAAQPGWTLAFQVQGDLLRSRVEHRLRQRLQSPLSFHPRTGAHASELLAYAHLVVTAIDNGSAAPDSSLAMVLENGFADLLLEVQPHTLGTNLSRSESMTRAGRVRALAEYVEGHLDEPLTASHLAEVAGCSVRSLQTTFAELCGMSPLEWVRRRRLSAARRLLESGTTASTVSEVALRTGFSHLARFAASYKKRYGEPPSRTLRRSAANASRPPNND